MTCNLDSFVDNVIYKLKTDHRDDMYKELSLIETSGIFSGPLSERMLIAFAIGFKLGTRKSIRNSTPFINVSTLDKDTRRLLLTMVSRRHPEIEDYTQLWDTVGEYAESGIEVLYNAVKTNNDYFSIRSIIPQDDQ